MSETLTGLASENFNPGLKSLLEDVQRGHIRVPRFQRPFIWSDAQRLELLRSVRDNMPIGSLLIWRTSKFSLASFPSVGPHPIPPIADYPPTTGWQYILDGHQRVSVLLGVLLQPRQSLLFDDESIDWDIQYDLREEDFVFPQKNATKRANRPLLPLWTLLDGRHVNKHMRDIRKQGEEGKIWTESDMEAWEEKADQLSYSFQQYRIPIVVMVTDQLSRATETFQRINSLGTPMSEAHLIAALTWSNTFDLRERLDALRNELPPGWRDISETIFLQVCKGLVGLDMTKSGQTELVTILKASTDLLDQAAQGIQRAISLLDKEAMVVRQEFLPYAFQLVLLAIELAKRERNSDSNYSFMRWFWRTCWSGVFSLVYYWQIRSEQEALKTDRRVAWIRERRIPQRFDFRSARVSLFVLRLARRRRLYGADGQPIDGRTLLAAHGRNALVRLFSAPHKASPTFRQRLHSAGNSFLIDPNTKSTLRDRLLGTDTFPDDELEAHFIDADMLATLRAGDLETFFDQRAKKMEEFDWSEWHSEALMIVSSTGQTIPVV